MALEVWPLGVIVAFVMLWLRRRCVVRLRSRMVEDMAARARLLRFVAVQAEQREFFHLFRLHRMSTAGLQRRTVWVRQRDRPIILASSCHKLERHGMETKLSYS